MRFRVEWYETADGKVPGLEFMKDLRRGAGPDAVKRVLRQTDLLSELGFSAGSDVIHKVRGDLWELRATHRKNPYRVLFYNPRGDLIVLLHFFHKKTDAILENDIQRAERRMEDDRQRRGW